MHGRGDIILSRRIKYACLSVVLVLCAVFFTNTGNCSGTINVGGYWENWEAAMNPGSSDSSNPVYYENDLANFDRIFYSFLTLAQKPDPSSPPNERWGGLAIYESMTQANVIDVMTKTDPTWDNPNDWQRIKIQAMIDECQANGKKFIWAIGGWSDLTQTISDDQVSALVAQCVLLLKLGSDGIDFDWEHLSNDPAISYQQRRVMGKLFPALRKALDENGLSDKMIGYTTRLNAFWNDSNRPQGVSTFITDGEGIDIAETLASQGSTFADCVDWANIMMYDIPPTSLGEKDAYSFTLYQTVLSHFAQYVPKESIIMGFEPGGQMSGGVWEGMALDVQVIDYIKANGYGGIMFWAINQPATPPSSEVTGMNAQKLAGYAKTGVLASRDNR